MLLGARNNRSEPSNLLFCLRETYVNAFFLLCTIQMNKTNIINNANILVLVLYFENEL